MEYRMIANVHLRTCTPDREILVVHGLVDERDTNRSRLLRRLHLVRHMPIQTIPFGQALTSGVDGRYASLNLSRPTHWSSQGAALVGGSVRARRLLRMSIRAGTGLGQIARAGRRLRDLGILIGGILRPSGAARHLQRLPHRLAFRHDGRTSLDRKAGGGDAAGGSLATMRATRVRLRAARPTARRHDGLRPRFHVGPSVPLVAAHASRASRLGAHRGRHGAGPLKLAEDGILVGQEISHQTIAITFVQRESALRPGPQDARREGRGERRHVRIVSRGEIDEAGEVGGDGVERGDVGES